MFKINSWLSLLRFRGVTDLSKFHFLYYKLDYQLFLQITVGDDGLPVILLATNINRQLCWLLCLALALQVERTLAFMEACNQATR